MSNDTYVVLYLLYGFTFILMGLYAIREYKKATSVFPLVEAIIYLGIFGIIHGISEWLTMFRYANILENYRIELFFIGRVLKAVSFLALFQFGFTILLQPFWRKVTLGLLVSYFFIWLIIFYQIIFVRGMNYLYDNPAFLIITLRYMMALPGSIITVIALVHQGIKIKPINTHWMHYYFLLGFVFFIYGLLDGLFVRRADFFPANVFYNQWFNETLGIPIQVFKIIVGISFYIAVRLVIHSFSWEKQTKWLKLKSQESFQRKQGEVTSLLHDKLIQSLYITGLDLESKALDSNDEQTKVLLNETVKDLNENIELIRSLIAQNVNTDMRVESFTERIQSLIDTLSNSSTIHFTFKNHLPKQGIYTLNKHYDETLYDIIQELLINANKHSKASQVDCILFQEYHCLKIIVKDNGIGFNKLNLNKENSYGLKSLSSKVEALEGTLKIKSSHKRFKFSHTTIVVMIPSGGFL